MAVASVAARKRDRIRARRAARTPARAGRVAARVAGHRDRPAGHGRIRAATTRADRNRQDRSGRHPAKSRLATETASAAAAATVSVPGARSSRTGRPPAVHRRGQRQAIRRSPRSVRREGLDKLLKDQAAARHAASRLLAPDDVYRHRGRRGHSRDREDMQADPRHAPVVRQSRHAPLDTGRRELLPR